MMMQRRHICAEDSRTQKARTGQFGERLVRDYLQRQGVGREYRNSRRPKDPRTNTEAQIGEGVEAASTREQRAVREAGTLTQRHSQRKRSLETHARLESPPGLSSPARVSQAKPKGESEVKRMRGGSASRMLQEQRPTRVAESRAGRQGRTSAQSREWGQYGPRAVVASEPDIRVWTPTPPRPGVGLRQVIDFKEPNLLIGGTPSPEEFKDETSYSFSCTPQSLNA